MARRVKPGDKFNITAAEYNRLLAAADTVARDRLAGGVGNRTHVRDAATVRVHYQSSATVPIGGIVGFEAPLGDPDAGPDELARFVRDATVQSIEPNASTHSGLFGVAIEPIGQDKVGRVVFAGVVAARVLVQETWHQYADVADSGGLSLQSKPNGSAQILWRSDRNQLGEQWAVVRVGKPADPAFLVKVPSGGIPGRSGIATGSANCDLYRLDDAGEIQPVVDPDNHLVRVTVRNPSVQRIRGPVGDDVDGQYLNVTYDGNRSWIIDPPKQTLLCKPLSRIKAKSWGMARELRFTGGAWSPAGVKVEVYNVCDYALLASQQIVCHFHEDTSAYLTIGCRCCDGSSGSSSGSVSSSSSASSSDSSGSSSSSSSSGSSSLSSSSSSSLSSSSSSSGSSASSISSSSESSTSASGSSSASMSLSLSSSSASSLSQSSSSHSSQSSSSGSSPSSDSSQSVSTSLPSFFNSQSSSQSSSGSSQSSKSIESSSSGTVSSRSDSSDSQSESSRGSESYSTSASASESSHSESESASPSSDSRSLPSYSDSNASVSHASSGSASSISDSVSSVSRSDSESESRSSDSEPSSSDESESRSDSERPSDSDSRSYSVPWPTSHSSSGSASGSQSVSASGSGSDSSPSTSDSQTPSVSDSQAPSVSDSQIPSTSDSDRPSVSHSDSEPPSEPPISESSTSEPCHTTWIWSCGWQLLDSDCPDAGEPPGGSGGYDGEVVEVAA
jgi:hypothetical protein